MVLTPKNYRKPRFGPGSLRAFLFLILWFIFIVIFQFLGVQFMRDSFPEVDQNSPSFQIIAWTIQTIFTIIMIYVFQSTIDHRNYLKTWFSSNSDLLFGFIIGSSMISVGSAILGQSGLIEFSPGNLQGREGLQYTILFFVAALFEELVFRGYVLTNFLYDMPKAAALLLSSALFMLVHLNNPSIDTLPLINLFLAGILLGASFIYTNNLWLPLGLHWSWNLFQGPVFGYEVSGIATNSLFAQEILHNNIWTGGDFGFEGSLTATIIMVLVISIIVSYYEFNLSKNDNQRGHNLSSQSTSNS